jgi:hypothetical protein
LCQQGVDGVLAVEMIHHRDKAYFAADPAYGMVREAGGNDSAEHRVAYCEDREIEPEKVGRSFRRRFSAIRRTLRAVSAKESAHTARANQAVRVPPYLASLLQVLAQGKDGG